MRMFTRLSDRDVAVIYEALVYTRDGLRASGMTGDAEDGLLGVISRGMTPDTYGALWRLVQAGEDAYAGGDQERIRHLRDALAGIAGGAVPFAGMQQAAKNALVADAARVYTSYEMPEEGGV